ncbi:2Fe-2S iron-sulfur cluster-binding protein [Chitinimonas sp. BJB300]|uniref:2Fe-2S iron-sulfur cluster-binding protein n=1 Tax=Chitinimonas sp. BJB300 TaxID=1559339 RepID=UPI000C110929|nr:2Fe-2S iron-sulfur cluster-binding protein [Chitinimonas sp. BJB300]PHV13069.1 ferredoxin [Chitinimonas sp. BJB300]
MGEPLQFTTPSSGLLIDVVRELAGDGQLPLYWRCGQGTCGACLVYLQHADQPGELVMGGKERNVLVRMRLLNEAQRVAAYLPDTPALPRLACHVHLLPGELQVHW